ncbi:hypothetical protein [Bosea sp. UC22_33]|uniref:hypothetical protein n=1 Tax=Bosea sp. UC22_33 TaxID=3350165 RepID=UPI00366AD2E9
MAPSASFALIGPLTAFSVSDDGYASVSAELMGLEGSFGKVASGIASRAGIAIERKAFVLHQISREQLPGAVLAIASSSVRAVDHAIQAARTVKIKRSRETFNARVKRAFGDKAVFDATVRGATREWEFEAAIAAQYGFAGVISLVSPGHGAVASANMKLGDIRAMGSGTKAIAALVDYDGTEPAFRTILTSAADAVIPASADPMVYLKAAEPISAGIH